MSKEQNKKYNSTLQISPSIIETIVTANHDLYYKERTRIVSNNWFFADDGQLRRNEKTKQTNWNYEILYKTPDIILDEKSHKWYILYENQRLFRLLRLKKTKFFVLFY